ncbi:Chemotaxis protein PomA [Gammaproteobacteria bacterium]|nr:MAG: flagellar motor protein [Gammaproteobacteria bacterium]CAG0938367.1 Chemotaxis protein PomA [Gammaproteobacteria bacterium]
MDPLTTTGVVLALVALIGGSILKGAGISSLANPAAFVIVFIGTLASSLVQTPKETFLRAWKIFPWIFKPPVEDTGALIAKMVEWSETARKQGLLGLEPALEKEPDEFAKKALQMLVDGTEPDKIRETMELELEAKEKANTQSAKVFEGLGIYAPTLGIIGAVLGLIAVMKNLADPSKLGHGIAAAFTATIYGIGLANLFFLPTANKLKEIIKAQSRAKEMVLEGIIAIAEGENPRNLEVKLKSYVA